MRRDNAVLVLWAASVFIAFVLWIALDQRLEQIVLALGKIAK